MISQADLSELDLAIINSATNYASFVRESNKIEGIHREPTREEVSQLQKFVSIPRLGIEDVIDFVKFTQPDARLRDVDDRRLDVRVGNHIAPSSGPEIRHYLGVILGDANMGKSAYDIHTRYLTLHPFTDGNGRSARAIWLWTMNGRAPLGFLHQFYYQALDASDGRA